MYGLSKRGPLDFVVQEFTMERLRSASIRIRILEPILVFAIFLPTFFAPPVAAQQHTGSSVTGCLVADLPTERYQTPPPAALVAPTAEGRGDGYDENQEGISAVAASGGKPDYHKAKKLFERAASKGYPAAQVNLAITYFEGWGTAQNYGAAVHWLTLAASRGNARGLFDLGLLYFKGCGVRQDNAEALRLFREAAEKGDSGAQANVGYMYDHGVGVPEDRAAAAAWYRKAAEAGEALAQNNLGDMYCQGDGVPLDYAEAFHWFQKAAEQGHTGAEIMLAHMYAQGRGAEVDLETAYAWVMAASLAGDLRGQELISSLKARLARQEIARAEDRARKLLRVAESNPPQVALVR
jgi:uncharacterized protein